MLRAKRGRIAPAQIVLIAGRKKRAWFIDGQCKASRESDLRDLIDKDAVFGQFGADCLEEGQLRREFGKALPQLGLTVPHFVVAWRTPDIEFDEFVDQCT